MSNNLMFFCIPQQAYMCTDNCTKLRNRPMGKVPAGAQPKLRACENCTMHPLVDNRIVPTVTLVDYLKGGRPRAANLNSAVNKKMMQEHLDREAV